MNPDARAWIERADSGPEARERGGGWRCEGGHDLSIRSDRHQIKRIADQKMSAHDIGPDTRARYTVAF